MEITAGMVRDLREKTNVGMMDCKKALQDTNGDMEKAIDLLPCLLRLQIGYQDRTGFHAGVMPTRKEVEWPPFW